MNDPKSLYLQNQHCILDVHLGSVDRLHQNQIYPIVLLIKFKSVKQIKEVCQSVCSLRQLLAKVITSF